MVKKALLKKPLISNCVNWKLEGRAGELLTLKQLAEGGQFDHPCYGFSKTIFSRKSPRPFASPSFL